MGPWGAECLGQKKNECLVSGYPTDPNILGPTQTFFEGFLDIKVLLYF